MGVVAFSACDAIHVSAPPERVWALVSDLRSYPRWWPASLRVRASPDGRSVLLHPRGGVAFECRVDDAESPRRLRIRYPGPRIQGTGEWRLESDPDGTRVTYEVDLRVRVLGAKLLGRWIDFAAVHSRGMVGVFAGLQREVQG